MPMANTLESADTKPVCKLDFQGPGSSAYTRAIPRNYLPLLPNRKKLGSNTFERVSKNTLSRGRREMVICKAREILRNEAGLLVRRSDEG